MAKVTVYKNSKFATFISFLGYVGIVLGIYSFFKEDLGVVVGIISLVIGIALKVLAAFIGKKKTKKDAENNQDI